MQRKELSDIMKVEKILARCRSNILEAVHKKSYGSFQEGDFLPMGSVYRNPYAFHQLSPILINVIIIN